MNTIVKNVPVWDRRTKTRVTIDVDVEVDVYNVAVKLGQRAFENKSRKSAALSNNVVVVVRP
jgi:hypothetical protein